MPERIYRIRGIIGNWKIIREEIKARSEKEAKNKLRRRYPKIQSVKITDILLVPF